MRALLLSGVPELVLLSLAFLSGEGERFASIFVSALIHELGHVIAARLAGVKLRLYKTGISGLSLSYDFSPVSPLREAAVCLAGPAIGMLIFIICYVCGIRSYFADSCAVLSVFNLLPISYLDGGCALSAILSVFLSPDTAWRICRVLSVLLTFVFWCASLYLMLRANGDISAMAVAIYLLYRLFSDC